MKEEYTSYRVSKDFELIQCEKSIFYDITETFVSFLCFYPLLMLAVVIVTKRANSFTGLTLVIPIMAMCIIRRNIKRFALYMAAMLSMLLATVLILMSNSLRLYYFLFVFFYAVYFTIKRVKHKNDFLDIGKMIGMNIFTAILYGFYPLYKSKELQYFIFISAIIQILVFTIYFHLCSSERLLKWENDGNKNHEKQMKSINKLFSFIMIVVIVAAVGLSWKAGIFNVLDFLNQKLFKPLSSVSTIDKQPQKIVSDTPNNNPDMFSMLGNMDSTANPFLSFIGFILKGIVLIITAVVTISILILIIQFIYRKILNRNKNLYINQKREAIDSTQKVSERFVEKIRTTLKASQQIFYKSNKEKIRAAYYRLILKYKKNGSIIEGWKTPEEIERDITHNYNVKLSEATNIYEKARYSTEEITDDQVKELKKLLSQDKKK